MHTNTISAFNKQVLSQIGRIKDQMSHPALGSFLNPASSCKLIPQDSQSGHYWIQHTGTGYANLEYCDMTRTYCNSTGGWMRVAHLNFTDTNQNCPSGFRLITSPKEDMWYSREQLCLHHISSEWSQVLQSVWEDHCLPIC